MYSIERGLHQLDRVMAHPNGYQALTYSFFLMRFAAGMIDTFGLIYLYTLGATYIEGIWIAGGYAFLQRLLVLIFIVPGGKLVHRLGFRISMFVALMSFVVKVGLFGMVEWTGMLLLLPAAVFGGLFICVYYVAYHGLFLADSRNETVASQMGMLEMVGRIATVLSPLFAGIAIERLGFEGLFGISMVVLLLSAAPLFLMPHHPHTTRDIGWMSVWREIKMRRRFRWSVLFMQFQYGINDLFWPIYLFVVVGGYAAFGSIFSMVMIVSSVAIFLAGKVYDEYRLHQAYPVITLTYAMLWGLRFATQTLVALVVVEGMARMLSPFWSMKARRYELVKGEVMEGVVFGMAHEALVSLGKMSAIVVGMGLLYVSGYRWEVLVIPAIAATLLTAYTVRNR